MSAAFTLPKSPRHGTVLPVTAAELSALTNAFTKNTKTGTASGGGAATFHSALNSSSTKNQGSKALAASPLLSGLAVVAYSVVFTWLTL